MACFAGASDFFGVLFVGLAAHHPMFLHGQGDPAIQIGLILLAHHSDFIGASEDVWVIAQKYLALVVEQGMKLADKGWVLGGPDGHVYPGDLFFAAAGVQVKETDGLPGLFKPFIAAGDVHEDGAAFPWVEDFTEQIYVGQALPLTAEAAAVELRCAYFERFEHV